MIKTVGIVSLSSGIIGESAVKHEVNLGVKRLRDLGLEVKFLEHAQKGMGYLADHPESRAQDLIQAFKDSSIDMILCAIGGDDTYRLLPYLFENDELKKVVHQKVFLGFSDTTINHLMLHKLGIKTFYGQSFLADVCELETDMLPYTFSYFKELITTGSISEIRPSEVWYEERTDFSEKALGTKRTRHENQRFELLKGRAIFAGEILGGCLESIYDIFELCPTLQAWKGKILLLETSEEKSEPTLYRKMLETLKTTEIFSVLNGILVGKPMDEAYYDEYKQILLDVIDTDIPILYNVNVGHATPRAIVPFGMKAEVDANEQVIRFLNELE